MELYSALIAANQKSPEIAVGVGQKLAINNSTPVRVMAKNTATGTPSWSEVKVIYWEGNGIFESPSTVIQIWCQAEDSRVTVLTGSSTTAGGETVSTIQGTGYVSVVSITRPGDVTAYAAGDITGPTDARLVFANVGPVDGHVILTGVDLRIDLAAVPSGMTSFRLHLFSALPTAVADNAVIGTYLADNAAIYRGYIDVGTPVAMGGLLYVQTDQINKQFKLGSGQSGLWGILTTAGGYTPASGATATLKLRSAGL
ncbi:MAG: hypothetical protein JWO82_2502 [Akkermansiaceae bacterium]|nr:hypothetical protein [Akkermansiaceae bacterium]